MEQPSYVSRFYTHLEVNEHLNFLGKIAQEIVYIYLVLPCGYTEEVGRKSGQTVAL